MSGGVVTVALNMFERLSGKDIPLWVYACILIFFLFLACYLAWRDERTKVAELDNKDRRKREFRIERLNGS